MLRSELKIKLALLAMLNETFSVNFKRCDRSFVLRRSRCSFSRNCIREFGSRGYYENDDEHAGLLPWQKRTTKRE